MAQPAVNGQHYQVRIKTLLHGQSCLNVINFTAVGTPDLIDDLLTPVLACFADNLLPVLSADLQLVGADVKNITGSTAQEAEVSQETDNVGEEAGDSLPSTNAAVLKLRTSHVGRTGKGRMFLAGLPESGVVKSNLDPTFIAAAVAFLACMFTAYHAGDPPAANQFIWSVWSRKDSAFYPVESYSVNPIVGTMRSRKVQST